MRFGKFIFEPIHWTETYFPLLGGGDCRWDAISIHRTFRCIVDRGPASYGCAATRTIYDFTCGSVDLKLTFMVPLLMDDLDLLLRPVNYISYEVTSNDGS